MKALSLGLVKGEEKLFLLSVPEVGFILFEKNYLSTALSTCRQVAEVHGDYYYYFFVVVVVVYYKKVIKRPCKEKKISRWKRRSFLVYYIPVQIAIFKEQILTM